MHWRMSTLRSQPGSTEIGNHTKLISVPTARTSPMRRTVRTSRAPRAPPDRAVRTCTRAREKPAAKMNEGATSPFSQSMTAAAWVARSSLRRNTIA